MNTQELERELLHDEQVAERIRMVARIQCKRLERNRTLERRAARFAKLAMQGRV